MEIARAIQLIFVMIFECSHYTNKIKILISPGRALPFLTWQMSSREETLPSSMLLIATLVLDVMQPR
jgi:hypothetical protein